MLSNRHRRAAAWMKKHLQATAKRAPRAELHVEQLEARENPAPVAAVSGLANVNPFLGDTANFSFVFTNADAADTGYSPFFDLFLETSGPDGTTNTPPSGLNPTTPGTAADGFAASSGGVVAPTVTASGLALIPVGTPTVLAAGQTTYTNPFTGQTLAVDTTKYGAGDTIYTYQLPFGSFTPGQNTRVNVSAPTSRLADVGTPLDLTVRPGFRDTDGNPNPPLVPAVYADASATATPKLYDFIKTYVGPEDETATGPNYVRRYRLSVDIATGQTIQGADTHRRPRGDDADRRQERDQHGRVPRVERVGQQRLHPQQPERQFGDDGAGRHAHLQLRHRDRRRGRGRGV